MNEQRDSKPEFPPLITDPGELAAKEAENAILQFDAVLDMIDEVERDGRPFKLRPSRILTLHRIAMEGLTHFAGNWRPGPVEIQKSKHVPPANYLVPELMEGMCDWVNERWSKTRALELCSYVMWRLNWIHPFADGNGRTSRAVSYLVLCAKSGIRLPGTVTIPEIISRNKQPYYDALEKVDESVDGDKFDLSPMTELLDACLSEQLMEAYKAAAEPGTDEDAARTFH